jgi:hypothetical protein
MNNRHSLVPNYRVAYLFFCLSLITLPLNLSLSGIVRLPDVFIILTVIALATSKLKFKTNSALIFLSFYIVLLFSDLLSIWQSDIRFKGIVFYYKYSFIFIIPLILSNIIINRKRMLFLVKILYVIYLVLVIWVYIYYVLRVNDLIQGNSRVSFPLSDYKLSDAHLYASYLSFTFIAYFEYFKKILNHGNVHSTLVLVTSAASIILTGSKTGVLILMIYSFVVVIRLRRYMKTSYIKSIIVISIAVSIMSFILVHNKLDMKVVETMYMRSVTVNLNESSIISRYNYLFNAVDEIGDNLLLIGNGPTGAKQKWYDGGISIILAHSGLLGLLLLCSYIYMLFINSKKYSYYRHTYRLHKVFTLLLFIYLILSVITEHYLITRNILPVATTLSVIYANIKLNYIESSNNAKSLHSLKYE